MRSRYCAYAISLPLYIINTTHPLNNDFMEDTKLWKQEIIDFSSNFDFEKLTILEFIDNADISYVTFTAKISHNNSDHSFTEKSKFIQKNNRWLYLSGEQM